MTSNTKANLRGTLSLTAVAVLMAAVGFMATVQLAAWNNQGAGQDPAVQGAGQGPTGRGMMGPGGPGRGGPGGGPGGMFGPELRALDLTDAQREQVKAIMESHRDEQKAIGDRVRAARAALQAVIEADPLDEGAVRAKALELGTIEADAAVLRAKIHAAVFAILTPEQVKKAKELRGSMEQRMRGGRGRMWPHPVSPPQPRAEDDLNLPETV